MSALERPYGLGGCQGGGNANNRWMVKIKTYAYMQRLRQALKRVRASRKVWLKPWITAIASS
ncbi:hypothetical protein QUB77_20255 [Microcoleus sp. AT9b-C3]